MSNLITTANDKSVELQIRSVSAVRDMARRASERLNSEEGQTAAEYLGVLVLIAAIVAAFISLNIGGKIAGAVGSAIDNITNGGGGGGGGKPPVKAH